MFNREIILGTSPFEYLQQYYLAEARAVGSIFGDAIDDIVRQIRYYITHATDFNPVLRNRIDYNTSGTTFMSGWQFDTETNTVSWSEPPYDKHPIAIRYHFNPVSDFKFSIDERECYDSTDDWIILNVNMPSVKRIEMPDEQIRTSIVHELVHSLQMWVDAPGRMTEQNVVYRDFMNNDYLESKGVSADFIDSDHFKVLQCVLFFLSDTETEAMKEEVEEYIRKNGRIDVMRTDYMTSESYLSDFFEICSHHIYYAFRNACNALSRMRDIDIDNYANDQRYRFLVLLTSILVDKEFIKDSYHKDFADYKQCKRVQSGDFAINNEIAEHMLKAIDFLGARLDDFISDTQKEIRNACRKYKINEVLDKEDVHRLVESKWKRNYPKVVYESASPYLQKQKYQYQDYRELLDYGRDMEQIEYITESMRLLFENLFNEDPMQLYGSWIGPCIVPPSKSGKPEKFITHEEMVKIFRDSGIE